jgi:hypothetical protein
MAYEFPPDLLDAQRAYYKADLRVREVTDKLPSASAIVAGEAEITEEQHAELDAVRAERLRLVGVLYNHPWWKTVENEHAARMQLQAAAKA